MAVGELHVAELVIWCQELSTVITNRLNEDCGDLRARNHIAGQGGWVGLKRTANVKHKGCVGIAIANKENGRVHSENGDVRSGIAKTKDLTSGNRKGGIVKKAGIRKNGYLRTVIRDDANRDTKEVARCVRDGCALSFWNGFLRG